MKLRRVSLQNVRSFLERQELHLDGDISILIGPNGGGKTNILDAAVIALRLYLLKSWIPRHNPTEGWQDRYEWTRNDVLNNNFLEKHSAAISADQIIEIDIEVTETDVSNINTTISEFENLAERSKIKYVNTPQILEIGLEKHELSAGQVLTYVIQNGHVSEPTTSGHRIYKNYLEYYEIAKRLREEFESKTLSTPMIFLPVTRTAGGVTSSVSLADFDEYNSKRTVDAASSRSAGSIISLAIGRMAERLRDLLELDNGQATKTFRSSPSIIGFTEALSSLGYSWEMKCINKKKNQYDIELTKQGSTFKVSAASSGEREFLTYLFAIYALNLRDALIVIDEPELHLHPRWQRTLLSLFERLSIETNNQFVMATHSPIFVSPSSIQYVSRVYSENQRSRITRLDDAKLPERKHLFNIINSQNNERIFFSDVVILVEGISDKIFFEALFATFEFMEKSGKIYEVVSVGGKNLFRQYEKLLNVSRIKYAIIADLDYAKDVGDQEVKSLFSAPNHHIKQKVVDDASSIDGAALVESLDEAIRTGAIDKLKNLWDYIKERHSGLKRDMSDAEKIVLADFIHRKAEEESPIFILSRGALEAYLPDGYKGKDIEKLIRLTTMPGFLDELPVESLAELRFIIEHIPIG